MGRDGDIYRKGSSLQAALRRLETQAISDANKNVIRKNDEYLAAQGRSLSRRIKYIQTMGKIAEWLNVDFENTTKDDILRVAARIEGTTDYEPTTREEFKVILRKFFQWLRNTDIGYPPEVAWLKIKHPPSRGKLPEELLNEDEILAMLGVAEHTRDRAFIAALWESGGRIGEILTLTLGDLEFDANGVVLHVDGKTSRRRVRLVSSAGYLAQWLDQHPARNDKKAPVWVLIGTLKKSGALWSYAAAAARLREIAAKAGVKKRVNPHSFRHARATFLANHFTEFQMNRYLGWTQGSNMPATYVHLSGRDVDKAVLALNGVATPEEQEIKIKPKLCPRCKETNLPTSQHCSRCSSTLDLADALTQEDKLVDIITQMVLLRIGKKSLNELEKPTPQPLSSNCSIEVSGSGTTIVTDTRRHYPRISV